MLSQNCITKIKLYSTIKNTQISKPMLRRKSHRLARKRKRYQEKNSASQIPREIIPPAKALVSPSSLGDDSNSTITSSTAACSSSSGSRKSWEEEKKLRIAILQVYKHMGEPPTETWSGRNGTIATLQRVFSTTHRSTIEKVLTEHNYCVEHGKSYNPERKERRFLGEYLIPKIFF